MKKNIVVTFQFEGIHAWPNCPIEEVKFLRDPHRHIFHVKAIKEVSHNDRDVEIIWLKRQMEGYIKEQYADKDFGRCSCEDMAELFINMFGLKACEVLEDGENGAYLIVDEEDVIGGGDSLPLGFGVEVKAFKGCICNMPYPGGPVVQCKKCDGMKKAL